MGCKPSTPRKQETPEARRAANIKAMEKNKARGMDAMGHDPSIVRVTPGTPEFSLMQRQMHQHRTNPMIGASGAVLVGGF